MPKTMMNENFSCEFLNEKNCSDTGRNCCYFCDNLNNCLKEWKKAVEVDYWRTEKVVCVFNKENRWCEFVYKFLMSEEKIDFT